MYCLVESISPVCAARACFLSLFSILKNEHCRAKPILSIRPFTRVADDIDFRPTNFNQKDLYLKAMPHSPHPVFRGQKSPFELLACAPTALGKLLSTLPKSSSLGLLPPKPGALTSNTAFRAQSNRCQGWEVRVGSSSSGAPAFGGVEWEPSCTVLAARLSWVHRFYGRKRASWKEGPLAACLGRDACSLPTSPLWWEMLQMKHRGPDHTAGGLCARPHGEPQWGTSRICSIWAPLPEGGGGGNLNTNKGEHAGLICYPPEVCVSFNNQQAESPSCS